LGEGVLEQLAESLHDSETSLEEQFRALGDCLARMPLPDRELLSRRYAPQATTAQVAADTGCSIHQMYRQLRRLHRALFDCVTKALSGREELQ
jgi:DNA-directed RNA polymerase specialized sigma24 family protein